MLVRLPHGVGLFEYSFRSAQNYSEGSATLSPLHDGFWPKSLPVTFAKEARTYMHGNIIKSQIP
jgi:hypothetical protein